MPIKIFWVLFGVGGIFDADDAWQLLRAGADLVQAYTGFVYGGPAFAGRVNRGLVRRGGEWRVESGG